MAIIPHQLYTGKINAPNALYPLGSARNVSAPEAGDGTPLLANWVNDIWGLLQYLLSSAGIEANGTPDSAGNHQYFNALEVVINDLINTRFNQNSNVAGLPMIGRVNGDGSVIFRPNSSWLYANLGGGNYRVTHNLNTMDYKVDVNVENGNGNIGQTNQQPNFFEVRLQVHNSDQALSAPWNFTFWRRRV